MALGGPSRGFDRFGFRWRNIRVVNVDAPINGHRRPRPHRLFSVPFYQLLLGFNGCFSVLPYFTGYHWVWNGFCKVFFKNNSVVFKQSLKASCGIRIGFFLKVQVGGGRTPMDVTLNTERGEGQKSQPEATWKREGSGGPYRVSLPSCFLFFFAW